MMQCAVSEFALQTTALNADEKLTVDVRDVLNAWSLSHVNTTMCHF